MVTITVYTTEKNPIKLKYLKLERFLNNATGNKNAFTDKIVTAFSHSHSYTSLLKVKAFKRSGIYYMTKNNY